MSYRSYFYLLSVLKWFLFDSFEQFQLQALVCKYAPFQSEQGESSASRNYVWGLYDVLYYLRSKEKQELQYFYVHELFKCSNILFQTRFATCWCSLMLTMNWKRKAYSTYALFRLKKLLDLIWKTYRGPCFQKQHQILDLHEYNLTDFNREL